MGVKTLKKVIIFIIMLSGILTISCNNEVSQNSELNKNKMYSRVLTESEEELLSLIGFNDTVEIYDFETDGSFKSISIWLEVYEDGELLENRGKMLSSFDSKKGSIAVKVNKDESYDWRISVKSEGQISSVAFESTDEFLKDKSYSIASSHMDRTEIENEKSIILKLFLFDSDGSTSIDGFQEYQENQELLKEYDYVYLLKAKFSKNRSGTSQMETIEEEK